MRYFYFIISIFISLQLLSCSDKAMDAIYSAQEKHIETYIEGSMKAHPEYKQTYNNGSQRLTIKEGTGEGLHNNGSVKFYYAVYKLDRAMESAQTILATNKQEVAQTFNFKITDPDYNPITLNIGKANLITGLKNGLEGVKKGEECYIMFTTKYAFGENIIGLLPANYGLLYHIWVEDVIN